MYIHEAVKKAIQRGGYIYRKSAHTKVEDVWALIKPTDSYATCLIIIYSDNKPESSSVAWNPTANDLMADDWEWLGDEFGNKVSNTQKSFFLLILH